jgi:sialic acid synthase SpsE
MPLKIIAEACCNWIPGINWHSLDSNKLSAVSFIENASFAGADYIKFQLFNKDNIKDSPIKDRLTDYIITEEGVKYLKGEADRVGIGFILTTMYPEAVSIAAKYADAIKIRYKDHENTALIDAALGTGKPVLISVPYPPLGSLNYNPRVFFCYCIPKYPPDPEDFNIDVASICRGFSSHFPHTILDVAYAINRTYKDGYIEKHVMVDQSKWHTETDWQNLGHEPEDGWKVVPPIDASVSITFGELKNFISQLSIIERIKRTRLT